MHFLFPIEIIAGENDTFVINETVPISVTIDPGIYYAYSSEISSDWPSLYDEMFNKAQTTDLSGIYSFKAATPVKSNQFKVSGIKITVSEYSGTWGLAVDDPSFDMDPRLFGFNEGDGTQSTDKNFIVGDYSRYGVWQKPQFGAWTKIVPSGIKDQYSAKAKRPYGLITRWSDEIKKSFEIKHVAGAHIGYRKTEDRNYSSIAGLAEDDFGNQWSDLWEEGISTGRDIIAVYPNNGDLGILNNQDYIPINDNPFFINSSERKFEILYPEQDSDFLNEADSTWSLKSENAEFYDIQVDFLKIPHTDSSVSGFTYYKKD